MNLRIRFSKEILEGLRKELLIAQKFNNLRLYKMVIGLLLINEDYSKEEIAGLLNVCFKTIYNWLSKFMHKGLACLYWYHYRGRGPKSRLTSKQKERLFKIIEDGPEKYGFDSGIWNSAMIREVIQKEFNVTYDPRYICSMLKKMGLSDQKAAFISDHLGF